MRAVTLRIGGSGSVPCGIERRGQRRGARSIVILMIKGIHRTAHGVSPEELHRRHAAGCGRAIVRQAGAKIVSSTGGSLESQPFPSVRGDLHGRQGVAIGVVYFRVERRLPGCHRDGAAHRSVRLEKRPVQNEERLVYDIVIVACTWLVPPSWLEHNQLPGGKILRVVSPYRPPRVCAVLYLEA